MDTAMQVIRGLMQRGGEPLSVVELLRRDTLSAEMAARLFARVREGSSFLVGAVPGGAGKTTVMCALLALVPEGERVAMGYPDTAWEKFGKGGCVVTGEIQDHPSLGYIWGRDVREFTRIPARGGRIASTIHADTLDQARAQVAVQCGAGEEGLAAFSMFIPIEFRGSARKISAVFQCTGNAWRRVDDQVALSPSEKKIREFLEDCVQKNITACEDIRKAMKEN